MVSFLISLFVYYYIKTVPAMIQIYIFTLFTSLSIEYENVTANYKRNSTRFVLADGEGQEGRIWIVILYTVFCRVFSLHQIIRFISYCKLSPWLYTVGQSIIGTLTTPQSHHQPFLRLTSWGRSGLKRLATHDVCDTPNFFRLWCWCGAG